MCSKQRSEFDRAARVHCTRQVVDECAPLRPEMPGLPGMFSLFQALMMVLEWARLVIQEEDSKSFLPLILLAFCTHR